MISNDVVFRSNIMEMGEIVKKFQNENQADGIVISQDIINFRTSKIG
jgi:hypothetical protein